jgi:membrane fusion protein
MTHILQTESSECGLSTILSNAQQNILGFNSNEALYRIKVQLKQQTINAYGQA